LGTFPAGSYTLDALLDRLRDVDGAVFLSLSDDRRWWRDRELSTPRENVTFEAGLAFSLFGRDGTAIVTDHEVSLPSDLTGLTTIPFTSTGRIADDVSDLHNQLVDFFHAARAERSALRALWSEREYAIVFHSYRNPEQGEFEHIVNINAVRAVALLTECHGRLEAKSQLYSSAADVAPVDGSNIVMLGSPASNKMTRETYKRIDPSLRYVSVINDGPRHILDRQTGQRFESVVSRGSQTSDYGLVTKLRSPFGSRHWILIIEGNYGAGTAGGARLTTDGATLDALNVDVGGEFQAVVEIPVYAKRGFGVGTPTVVAQHQISGRI